MTDEVRSVFSGPPKNEKNLSQKKHRNVRMLCVPWYGLEGLGASDFSCFGPCAFAGSGVAEPWPIRDPLDFQFGISMPGFLSALSWTPPSQAAG